MNCSRSPSSGTRPRRGLNSLIDRPVAGPLPEPDPIEPTAVTLRLDRLLATAALSNPQLQQVLEQIDQGRQRLRLARLNYVPDLTVSATTTSWTRTGWRWPPTATTNTGSASRSTCRSGAADFAPPSVRRSAASRRALAISPPRRPFGVPGARGVRRGRHAATAGGAIPRRGASPSPSNRRCLRRRISSGQRRLPRLRRSVAAPCSTTG